MARTKPPSDKVLTIRLTASELDRLETYCIERGRTKTEVLREMIRRLRPSSSRFAPIQNSEFKIQN